MLLILLCLFIVSENGWSQGKKFEAEIPESLELIVEDGLMCGLVDESWKSGIITFSGEFVSFSEQRALFEEKLSRLKQKPINGALHKILLTHYGRQVRRFKRLEKRGDPLCKKLGLIYSVPTPTPTTSSTTTEFTIPNLATSTPYPTYTFQPTYTPFPTWTPVDTPTVIPTSSGLLTAAPSYTFIPWNTPTPQPTYTDWPTYTPQPTYTGVTTSTPYPTNTFYPTYTPLPTYTALPTNTPDDTYTPYPTSTPYPTNTNWPTNTPEPTYTFYPTFTAPPTSTPYDTYTPYPTSTPYPTNTNWPTYTAQPTYTPYSTPTPTPLQNLGFETENLNYWFDMPFDQASWTNVNTDASEGTRSGEAGTIGDDQKSCIQYSLTVAQTTPNTNILFDWKTKTESCCDFFTLHINGNLVNSISGTPDSWVTGSAPIDSTTTNVLTWCLENDDGYIEPGAFARLDNLRLSTVKETGLETNPDCEIASTIGWHSSASIWGTALQSLTPNASFSSTTAAAQQGVRSLGSAAIGDNQKACIIRFVSLATNSSLTKVSFYWKVSSEDGYDFLRVYLNGVEDAEKISGNINWTKKSLVLTKGKTHIIDFCYTKDAGDTAGDDRSYIDNFFFE